MTKQNGKEGNKSDKKRKNRVAHKGNPRIAKSKEKRQRGPWGKHHDYTEWLKSARFSSADANTIMRYMPPEPTAQDLMLQAKYAE